MPADCLVTFFSSRVSESKTVNGGEDHVGDRPYVTSSCAHHWDARPDARPIYMPSLGITAEAGGKPGGGGGSSGGEPSASQCSGSTAAPSGTSWTSPGTALPNAFLQRTCINGS